MIVEELIAMLGYDLRGEENLNRFNRGLERGAMLANRLAVAMVAAGTIAAGALFALGKGVIETSAQFEGFETSLETIEGSAAKAKSSMDWITKFAAKTPYELAGVTEAFIKLRSYGMDPMDGTLSTLGDTASAMNKTLDQAVEAFADASTFQFERLKEFGITSSQKGDQVTFSWTKNGKQLTKVVKKNGEEIRKFLIENFGERFNGAMIRQSKTWNGMMSNLADAWSNFQRRIGDAGFFELMKSKLAGLMDYLGKLADDGTLDRWAKNFSTGLSWAVQEAQNQIGGLLGDLKFLFGWIKLNPEWWGPIKVGLMALGTLIFPKGAALLVLQDVLRWLEGKGSVIGDFAKQLSALTGMDPGSIGAILASLAAFGATAVIFGGTFGMIARGVAALAKALGLLSSAEAVAGLGTLTTIGGMSATGGFVALAASLGAAAGSIKLLYDAIREDKDGLNEALKDKVGAPLAGAFFDFLNGLSDKLPVVHPVTHEDRDERDMPARVDTVKRDRERADAGGYRDTAARPTPMRDNPIARFIYDLMKPTRDKLFEAIPVRPMLADPTGTRAYSTATDAYERRKQMERVTTPYNPNTPGLANLFANMNKTGAGAAAAPVYNDNSNRAITTNTSIALTVQQAAQAAAAAATATHNAVSNALTGATQPKARTQMGAF